MEWRWPLYRPSTSSAVDLNALSSAATVVDHKSHMIRTNQTYLRATQKSPDQWRLGGPKSENYVINARPMNALHFVPLFLHQKSARIFSASASFHSTFKVLKMAKFLENSRWYQAYKELASQGKLQLPEYEQVSDNHCNLQVFWKCL